MKNVAKLLHTAATACACPLLASAHPGHDGHDLTWDLRNHNFWNSPAVPFVIAMVASALVFRFAFRRK